MIIPGAMNFEDNLLRRYGGVEAQPMGSDSGTRRPCVNQAPLRLCNPVEFHFGDGGGGDSRRTDKNPRGQIAK